MKHQQQQQPQPLLLLVLGFCFCFYCFLIIIILLHNVQYHLLIESYYSSFMILYVVIICPLLVTFLVNIIMTASLHTTTTRTAPVHCPNKIHFLMPKPTILYFTKYQYPIFSYIFTFFVSVNVMYKIVYFCINEKKM